MLRACSSFTAAQLSATLPSIASSTSGEACLPEERPCASTFPLFGAIAGAGTTCIRPDRGRGKAGFNLAGGLLDGRDWSRSCSASENDPDAFMPPFTWRRAGAEASEAAASGHVPPPEPDDPDSPGPCSTDGSSCDACFRALLLEIVSVLEGASCEFRRGKESSPTSGKPASPLSASAMGVLITAGLMLCATLSNSCFASVAFLLV